MINIDDAQSPIDIAIKSLDQDSGALFEKKIIDCLCLLRGDDPAEFARIRAVAKASKKVSIQEFDRLTKPKSMSEDASPSDFEFSFDVWPESVDGEYLLDEVFSVLKQYVVADNPTIFAATLWIIFTWLIDDVAFAPIANITAPEKRCGKSVLLKCLGKLAYKPMITSNIAPAALFRSIELWSPTLLIDEVDTFLKDNEAARGILNAGFDKDAAYVVRCVGDDHSPTKFNVWGAKALCGIGSIADTLADRSIPLRLRRKKSNEVTERLSKSSDSLWADLRAKIARFVEDNRRIISEADPSGVGGLNDRANDCWEPLLQIAMIAGDEWYKKAINSALVLNGCDQEPASIATELLSDIKQVFETSSKATFFSYELMMELTRDPDSRWSTWNRGKEMTPRQLSMRLSNFGIRSKTVRRGVDTKKGYQKAQFDDAFERYLASNTSDIGVTKLQASDGATSIKKSPVTHNHVVTNKDNNKNTNAKGCDVVTVETPYNFF